MQTGHVCKWWTLKEKQIQDMTAGGRVAVRSANISVLQVVRFADRRWLGACKL